MIGLTLQKIDILSEEDITLTYEVLKYRFANVNKQQIMHKSRVNVPTVEEHKLHLNTNKYKAIYKITLNSYPLGTIHLSQHNEIGMFFLPSLIKYALRRCKEKNINIEIDKLAIETFTEFCKIHNDVELYFCSVNPNNHLSIKAIEQAGGTINELVYIVKNNKRVLTT